MVLTGAGHLGHFYKVFSIGQRIAGEKLYRLERCSCHLESFLTKPMNAVSIARAFSGLSKRLEYVCLTGALASGAGFSCAEPVCGGFGLREA